MNRLLKAEVKKGSYAEVGAKLDDMRESCEKDVRRYEGAISALAEATKRVSDLLAHVDKDFDEGKLVAQDANQVRALIKRWIGRCSGVCENLKDAAVTKQLQSTGKVASLEQSIRFVKSLYDAEVGKIKAIEEYSAGERPILGDSEEGGTVVSINRRQGRPSRPTGVHPGPSKAALRKSEAETGAEAEAEPEGLPSNAAETAEATEAASEPAGPEIAPATDEQSFEGEGKAEDTKESTSESAGPTGLPAATLKAPEATLEVPELKKKARRGRKKAQ